MRYKQIKPLSEQTLNEVNMSPGSLRKLAGQINAQAGMEFEMIVPDVKSSDNDDFESEPDYEADERTDSIRDIRHFFNSGDMNSSREVDRLVEKLEEEFFEWQQDQIDSRWHRAGQEYFREWIKENVPEEEWRTGDDDESDLQKFAEQAWEDQDSNYNDAFTDYQSDMTDEYDERDWLRHVGYHYMTDIENSFDISWPHYTEPGDEDGEYNIEDVADDFMRAIGRPVDHSSSYHGARRRPGHYVVEPDGSLSGDSDNDAGLEFVSPPLPIAELLSDLQKVKRWADNRGCYTGVDYSTGLHINVSVDGWGGVEKLDYVKLAILLGDDYVLKQFERESNTYCKGALRIVRDTIKQKPEMAKQLLDKMKEHLNTAASKLIHSGITNKFTSINTKDGYVEFRSPGGDWLNEFYDKIEPTLLRFVVALDAAVHEDKYKQEYQKKLYKLLEPSMDEYGAMVKDFSDYVSGVGGAPEAVVKDFRRAALSKLQQSKFVKSLKPGQKAVWSVTAKGQTVEVVATNAEGAFARAVEQQNNWFNVKMSDADIKPIRAYEEPPAPSLQNIRPSNPEGNWVIVMSNVESTPVYRFMAADRDDAKLVKAQWLQAMGKQNETNDYDIGYDPDGRVWGQPAAQATGTAEPSGNDSQQSGRYAIVKRGSRPGASGFRTQLRFDSPDVVAFGPGVLHTWASRSGVNWLDYEVIDMNNYETPAFQEPNANRGNLIPTGPGPWEIYRISDGSVVRALDQTNRNGAETEARTALGLRGEAPELYGVRTRQSTQPIPGSTMDLQNQRAAAATSTQQQAPIHRWRVMLGGEQVWELDAATQGEANRAAQTWILGRSREFMHDHAGQEMEIVPKQ